MCFVFLFEAMSLLSREYLFCQREVAENSGFNKFWGDSQGVCGANPQFSATAKSGGIFLEISPFEKVHGLTVNIRSDKERLW
jgi:hypothetical protein